MALFQFKWLRRFVRRHTTPIPTHTAQRWKGKLSVAYMLLAWNAFGFVCYMVYTGRNDWPRYYGYKTDEDANMRPGQYYANVTNVDKGKIIRFSGLTKVDELDFDKTEKDEAEST